LTLQFLCRHEIPEENKDMAKQNIKDRYRGVNDPVAKKILGRTNNMKSSLAPPEDTSVVSDQKGVTVQTLTLCLQTTLFITGLDSTIEQQHIK
jgi:pre-mRNA-splicing factor RBM22/SLT11